MEQNNKPFHETESKQARKNILRREIQIVSKDLLEKYPVINGEVHGYKIVYANLNSLFLEICEELSEEDNKKILDEREKLENLMLLPIYYRHRHNSYGGHKIKIQFLKDNWLQITNALFNYQKLVLRLDDSLNMDTKTKKHKREV